MLHPLIFLIGATYDSIEGRFRIIKREAAVLRAEIERGERPEAPPRGSAAAKPVPAASTAVSSFASATGLPDDKVSVPRKPRTPKKIVIKHENGDRVLTGRVRKNDRSPKKVADAAMMVKTEPRADEDSFFGDDHEINLQTDAAHDEFMEELEKAHFDGVLRYESGMGIWAPSIGEKGKRVGGFHFRGSIRLGETNFSHSRLSYRRRGKLKKSTWYMTTAYVPTSSWND